MFVAKLITGFTLIHIGSVRPMKSQAGLLTALTIAIGLTQVLTIIHLDFTTKVNIWTSGPAMKNSFGRARMMIMMSSAEHGCVTVCQSPYVYSFEQEVELM